MDSHEGTKKKKEGTKGLQRVFVASFLLRAFVWNSIL